MSASITSFFENRGKTCENSSTTFIVSPHCAPDSGRDVPTAVGSAAEPRAFGEIDISYAKPSNKVLCLILFLGVIFFISASSLYAQSFDYEVHPKLDFDFNSLTLDLALQPQNLAIDGAAQYNLTANIAGADTVILYASKLDIHSVSLNDSTIEHSVNNDSLFIPLSEPSKFGQEYTLRIRYSGSPHFGLLKDAAGTVWTSCLPKTSRHWVPIIDNPNVTLKTTFNISVPSDFEVWATGEKTGEDSVASDVLTHHFTSQEEVPASTLGLIVGKFDTKSFTNIEAGKKITLRIEDQLANNVDAQQILQLTGDYMSKVEDKIKREYPFDQLNIFVLKDHNWETKNWGASTVYLYENQGNLEHQLLRGIIAQWVGIKQRESQWKEADAINMYQASIFKEIADSTAKFKNIDAPQTQLSTVYDGFGIERWNKWQSALDNWQGTSMSAIIDQSQREFLTKLPPVIEWRDVAGNLYRRSGQPFYFKGIDLTMMPNDTASTTRQSPDSITYKVNYTLDEQNSQLELRFLANNQTYDSLIAIEAVSIYPDTTENSEITFTGDDDSIVLEVSPLINTVRLKTLDHPELHFDEYKPSSFLIYELRNAKTADQRAEAARKLGNFSDNPDLQLAISDFMNQETDPKVRAALLSSLSKITNGASGTEQVFLDALQSDSPLVRETALKALQGYQSNATITEQVQQIAINAERFETFIDGTEIIAANASPEGFNEYADRIIQQDTVGLRSIMVIELLAEKGQIEKSVAQAIAYLDEVYIYKVRAQALHILGKYDESPTEWATRAKELLEDPDPRIRFLTIDAVQNYSNQEITNFLQTYIESEYDARVYQKINQLLQ